MTQRFGTEPPDAVVTGFFLRHVAASLGLDPRQLELVAEDLRQLFERDIHLQDMAPGSLPAFPLPSPGSPGADGLADFPLALADAPRAIFPVAEMGHVQLWNGNADQIAPLAADHLAMSDVLSQILANFPADNLPET